MICHDDRICDIQGSMNCAFVNDLSILLSAIHKTSRFALMIALRLSNFYLIEFMFKYGKVMLQGF